MYRTSETSEAADYQCAWGETSTRPACIADPCGRLIWFNQAFTNLLAVTDVCRASETHLSFSDRAAQARFLAFVSSLNGEPGAFLAQQGGEHAYLIFRCELVRPKNRPPAVAVMVFDSLRTADFVWSDIGGVFGLTASEAAIARRLVDGSGLSVLARELGITEETAKTHLRRIYAKIGVGSREEFYARLLPFRVA